MDEPEPAVIRAAMAGDRAAFEEIVRTYQVPVWSFLTRLVADRTLAEDLTQETFIRVYRRLPGFAFRSKFSTWLLRITVHAALGRIRKGKRVTSLEELEENDSAPEEGRMTTRSPEDAASDDVLLFPDAGTNCAVEMAFGRSDDLFDGCEVVVSQKVVNNRVAICPP